MKTIYVKKIYIFLASCKNTQNLKLYDSVSVSLGDLTSPTWFRWLTVIIYHHSASFSQPLAVHYNPILQHIPHGGYSSNCVNLDSWQLFLMLEWCRKPAVSGLPQCYQATSRNPPFEEHFLGLDTANVGKTWYFHIHPSFYFLWQKQCLS